MLEPNAPVASSPTDPKKPPRRKKPDAEKAAEQPSAERLQKLIARAGLASRRAAEELITGGKVSVNGHVITELGAKADPSTDRITVNGRPLQMPSGPATVVLLHKPRGVMTTRHDPEGRTTVLDLLPKNLQHLHPVGRLDYDTSGVLLLSDDGDLTHALTHPSHQVEKVYEVRVRGKVEEKTLDRLRRGVKLEDGPTAPCHVRVKAVTERNTLLEIALREGRNRQVRRMLEAVGHLVSSLRRVRFAGVALEGLPPGEHRLLLPAEVHQLRKSLTAKPRPPRETSSRADAAKPQRIVAARAKRLPPRDAAEGEKRKPAAKSYGAKAKARATTKRTAPLAARIEKKWRSDET
jgi:pseudouridine synthase